MYIIKPIKKLLLLHYHRINHVMQRLLINTLKLYRYIVSPYWGNQCRFHPTCSLYAEQAIERFGCVIGSYLICRRILKCHPFHCCGHDPIPQHLRDHS